MKPTHQLRNGTHEDVTAWRFLKDAPMPVWVFRNFHDLGGGRICLHHRSGQRVYLGEWVVKLPEKEVAIVLKDAEFHKCFVELSQEAESG
jgi:hypothetical protein